MRRPGAARRPAPSLVRSSTLALALPLTLTLERRPARSRARTSTLALTLALTHPSAYPNPNLYLTPTPAPTLGELAEKLKTLKKGAFDVKKGMTQSNDEGLF